MHGVGTPTAGLHIADNLWVSGSNGHITASGNISSSANIYALTGSFSHVVGASPLTIQSDNFAVNSSGNISGSGAMRLKKNVQSISNAAGARSITMTETLYPPNTLITLDIVNSDSAHVQFTLPALAEGLEYTFVIKVGNGSGSTFKIISPTTDTLQGLAICANASEVITGGETFTVNAGATNKGDRFNVISDGVNWYLNAFCKCTTTDVTTS